MKLLKRINNNAALCEDSKGRQVVAFGRGVGFSKPGSILPLSIIERTFYGMDKRCLALIEELSPAVLTLAASIADEARQLLPHNLVRNVELSLADHIAFAIERASKRINIKMPLGIEIAQNYPIEYHIGEIALQRISKTFGVNLPQDEVVGIAMVLINGACGLEADQQHKNVEQHQDEVMLDTVVREIERRFAVKIDCGSFEYSRFATHMYYLFRRVRVDHEVDEANRAMYRNMRPEMPEVAACVESICARISDAWECEIDEGERLFLLLHINRILRNRR